MCSSRFTSTVCVMLGMLIVKLTIKVVYYLPWSYVSCLGMLTLLYFCVIIQANYEYLTETKVFTAFLSLLSHVFELWPSAADTFIRKLVFAGIVRLTLEVSTKYGYIYIEYFYHICLMFYLVIFLAYWYINIYLHRLKNVYCLMKSRTIHSRTRPLFAEKILN